MSLNTEWQEYLDGMYQNAFAEFRGTGCYAAMKENIQSHEELCKNDFTEREFVNIGHWIDKIYEVNDTESHFMYERGYRDCVALLRRLEVI